MKLIYMVLIVIAIGTGIYLLSNLGFINISPMNSNVIAAINTKSDQVKEFLAVKIAENGLETRSEVISQHEKTRSELGAKIHNNYVAITENRIAQKESEFSIKTTVQNYSMLILFFMVFSVFSVLIVIITVGYFLMAKKGGK